MPVCQWINCLSGVRGKISVFPAEMPANDNAPGISLRVSSEDGNVRVCPDFRAEKIFLDGELLLSPAILANDLPAILRMGKTLLAFCVSASDEWAEEYRFPLWTLFEPETFEPIETVRAPADVPAALARNRLREEECLVSPYGLPVAVGLEHVADLLR